MTRLPVISGKQLAAALARAGFEPVHQVGSHLILKRADPACRVSVPQHRELDRGTLRGIIKKAGISGDELEELLK